MHLTNQIKRAEFERILLTKELIPIQEKMIKLLDKSNGINHDAEVPNEQRMELLEIKHNFEILKHKILDVDMRIDNLMQQQSDLQSKTEPIVDFNKTIEDYAFTIERAIVMESQLFTMDSFKDKYIGALEYTTFSAVLDLYPTQKLHPDLVARIGDLDQDTHQNTYNVTLYDKNSGQHLANFYNEGRELHVWAENETDKPEWLNSPLFQSIKDQIYAKLWSVEDNLKDN